MQTEQLYQIFLQHPVVTTDSRDCPSGSMFFALKGASFDGNRYAAAALEKGCAVAVVDDPQCVQDDRYVLVPDVLEALQQLAAFHRRKWGRRILQVTGTNGKTTTKELVAAVLSRGYRVLWTEGNLNNHIGVPRTLLRMTEAHDLAVIETGANHPGEIAFLCGIVQADYGLITNVGRAHLEGFGSFEGVKRTKGELYDDLVARGGRAFLNMQDEDLSEMATTRGLETLPYLKGRVLACEPFLRMEWYDMEGKAHEVQTRLIGSYNLPNLLAAATVGQYFGIPASEVDEALAAYEPTNNRSQFADTGRNRLIVDAYNANPSSMAAAIANFAQTCFPKKMVILGDMKELGADSEAEHQKVVERLETSGADTIWLVGENFARADLSSLKTRVRCFADVEEVKAYLEACPVDDRTILIKGSNSTKLYQLPVLL